MAAFVTERTCRVCGPAGTLETILNLGDLYSSTFLRAGEHPNPPAPFDLCACTLCRLVQLRHTMNPELLFRKYWYQSGINETMRSELADIVEKTIQLVRLDAFDVVIDVGANDGTLLKSYPHSIRCIAFEPALNLNSELHKYADEVIADFFPKGLSQITVPSHSVKILTSIACFYDLDDPIDFIDAVERILHKEGVWVVQFQDWDQMQKATAFDNICTEHLFYPTLAAIERMIAPVGLQVIDAELRTINGGSYRLTIGHVGSGWVVSPNVEALREREAGAEDWDTFSRFAWRCHEAKRQIRESCIALHDQGSLIDVYGASTKFNTLAQWCDIGGLMRSAWERSPEKVGLKTVGTNIPIVSEEVGRTFPPAALLVGIWQFRETVLHREEAFLNAGGQLLFPLPRVEIVSAVCG